MAIIKPTLRSFGMPMPIKPHKDKLVERVVIQYPDFIHWFDENQLDTKYIDLGEHIKKCIRIFNEKPFINVKCAGKNEAAPCTNQVDLFSLPDTSYIPSFWCASCDPNQQPDKVETLGTTYWQALHHGWREPRHRNQACQTLIKTLAEAKGLPDKPTDMQILAFFYGNLVNRPVESNPPDGKDGV